MENTLHHLYMAHSYEAESLADFTTATKNVYNSAISATPFPPGSTLGHVLAAIQFLSIIIPIIEGLIPSLKRIWFELFGTGEQKSAVRALRALNAEKRLHILKTQL